MEETTATPEVVEAPIVEQADIAENAEPNIETVETKPEKTFTQSELDSIITKRIERERETTSKKVAQESRDAYIAEQGYEWNGKVITTESEYKQALKEQEYKEKDLPEDVIKQLLAAEKFREEAEPLLTSLKSEKKQAADFKAFYEAYPDAVAEDVPASVWEDYNNGKDLVDSYARHENQSLKKRLAEVEQKQQVEKQNTDNAVSSTGAIVPNGSTTPAFFTHAQVSKMSESDVSKNWSAIMESQKKW